MCRLFGMSAAPHRVRATFWLVDAEDSLSAQSRREPDGVGLGTYTAAGHPRVDKQPVAAYQDAAFAREARTLVSATFVAHIRYATTGGLEPVNTHPFEQDGRLFAHNGVVHGLDRLDAELGAEGALVHGATDSERVFALITKHARSTGDVSEAIVAAVGWIARNLPLYAVNLVLTTAHELWALRYPGVHGLHLLRRDPGGPHGGRHLEHASAAGTVRVRSGDLADVPAVVVASEPMDEDPGWRSLRSGELVHVAADLTVTSRIVLPDPPAHQLTLADLEPAAAAAQQPTGR